MVCIWTRDVLLMVGGEGEVVGAAEQRELDVCNCTEGEEVDLDAEVVWEEVMGAWRWEACMPCDGLPQLRACSSHREQGGVTPS